VLVHLVLLFFKYYTLPDNVLMLGQGPAYGWVDGLFAEVMQNLTLREVFYIQSF